MKIPCLLCTNTAYLSLTKSSSVFCRFIYELRSESLKKYHSLHLSERLN